MYDQSNVRMFRRLQDETEERRQLGLLIIHHYTQYWLAHRYTHVDTKQDPYAKPYIHVPKTKKNTTIIPLKINTCLDSRSQGKEKQQHPAMGTYHCVDSGVTSAAQSE